MSYYHIAGNFCKELKFAVCYLKKWRDFANIFSLLTLIACIIFVGSLTIQRHARVHVSQSTMAMAAILLTMDAKKAGILEALNTNGL